MINQKRLVNTLLDLVRIDSPSGEEKEISKFIAEKLRKLGGKVQFDNFGNLIAKFAGSGEPIIINSHLDTVEPGRNIHPQIKGDRIVSDGTTILGGDAKSGVAIILEALESLQEDKKSHLPIEVIFTLSEENGLLGALNLDYNLISAKHGVTFDGEKSIEHITTSAPGYSRIDVTISGRSAHAGMEPEKGISAIKIASEIISQLEVGRIDDETTANIGLIEGGSARNAVPETVHFKAEIRSRNLEKLEKHSLHFEKVFKEVMEKHPKAKIELNINREFDPYLFEENHSVIELISKTLKKLDLKPNLKASGGGADVNIFHTHGLEVVCVGIGDYNPHTTREYVIISEMLEGTKFCEELISIE